jgi:hypothetical protein
MPYAGRLYDHLKAEFGEDSVFMDIDSIDWGSDFVEAIKKSVASCDALLAVIGKQWLICADEGGRSRLENPEDFVRLEVAAALERGTRVIPVLVGGARMPRSDELPGEIASLARRHALDVPDIGFRQAVERLIATLRRHDAERRAKPESGRSESGAKPENDRGSTQEVDERVPQTPPAAPNEPASEASRDISDLVMADLRKRGAAPGYLSRVLIFSTSKQKTWLLFSSAHIYCVLDNRPKGGRLSIRWRELLADLSKKNISAVDRSGRSGLLRIGDHGDWLYSTALFGSGKTLEKIVVAEVERARATHEDLKGAQGDRLEAPLAIGRAVYGLVKDARGQDVSITRDEVQAVLDSRYHGDLVPALKSLADDNLLVLQKWGRLGAIQTYPCGLSDREFFDQGPFQVRMTKEGSRRFRQQ